MPETTLSRRMFLGAAGASILASNAGARILGANDRIQFALIGAGGRGSYLLSLALKRQRAKGDVQCVAVCDVYRKRLNAAARTAGGVPTYLHHEELLERREVDAVFVATPDHWHAPITLLAMEKGLDVYCEKPMTHALEEAKQVHQSARRTNRLLQVGVQALSWDRWHRVRDMVESGMLGQIVCCQGTYSRNDPKGDWNWPIEPEAGPDGKDDNFIEWKQWLGAAPARPFDADRFFRFRKYWDYSGGIATDLHYHIVAPFHLAVANEHPERVVGMGGKWVYTDEREVPDTFLNAADYPGKWSLTVQSSQVNEVGPVTMLRGTKATMFLGDEWEGPKTRQFDHAQIVPEAPYRSEFFDKYKTAEITIPNLGNQGDEAHVNNFFDCVRSRRQPNGNVDIGYTTMTNIALSVRSYRENRMFRFDSRTERVIE